MSLALYRRYRPETFEEVVGQEHVTLPLQQALRNGRVNHAYLFSGPRGCGKTTSARILARCLNCEQGPTPTPCGVCRSCVELANGGPGSIDVIEIDAASHGGVDDARDLRERAFFAPAASRFKIYIIDEAHMVTSAGFNALLKVVEEPPPHLKFIFATTEPEKVIGTIRSRTHHYPFRLIPPGVLREHLTDITAREGIKVEPEVLPLVVRAGAGSARDAMSVLDQLLAGADENGVSYAMATGLLGYTDAALLDRLIEAFAGHDGAAVFGLVDQVVESGHDPRRFLTDLLERFRDLVVLNAVTDPGAARALIDVPDDQFERMAAQARTFGAAELSRAADLVNTGLTEMRGATAPRLLLELVCARVLLPGADDAEQGLVARVDRLERRGVVLGAAAPAPMAPMGGGPRVVADEYDEPPVRRPGGAGQAGQAGQQEASGGMPEAGGGARGAEGQQSAGLGTPPWEQGGGGPGGAGGQQQAAGGLNAGGPSSAGDQPSTGLGTPPWEQGADAPSGDAGGQQSGGGALGTPPWAQGPGSGTSAPEPQAATGDTPGSAAPDTNHNQRPPSDFAPASAAPESAPSWAAEPTSSAPPEPPAWASDDAAPMNQPSQPSQPPPSPASGGVDIRRMWPDLLEEVKRRDGRVSWMLLSQNAQVLGLDGDRLQVAFVNAGARDRFVGRKTSDTLRQAVQDLFGFKWQVDAIVDPSQTPGTQVSSGVSMTPPPAQMPPPPGAYQPPQAPAPAQSTPPPPPQQSQSQQPNQSQQRPEPPRATQAPTPPPQQAAPPQQPPQAQPRQSAPAPAPAPSAPAPPPTPTVRPEDDVVSEYDEVLAEDNATAHELVIRELGAQRLDGEQ
ncbi:DNA polymerase III subunit gamma and tau [Catenulispora sp. NL8]|uniref:DNA-directed DNA polymerase n=1 Tax=Catenulispora pinistramenti TaxID=2705254 RepID=A0ABS5KNL6_9ACTN|nr:DNA polymerase III subunit gamma and tau [Catenulispora pinistramenti]MBS2547636.1 DNA polymerase III subunit gamma and tau [Catenulispora pinistramenti]